MSTKFYKFNQGGVGRDLQFGKQGGTIKWDPTDNKFSINNGAGQAGTMVEIRPLDSNEYGAGALSKNITDRTLVTAGYVKGLIQGFRTKASVQSVVMDYTNNTFEKINLPASAFDAAAGFSKDPDDAFAGVPNKKVYQVLGLRNMGQADGSLTAAQRQDIQAFMIGAVDGVHNEISPAGNIAGTDGMRVLVKDQTDATKNGIYELKEAGTNTNFYLRRTKDMDVEDEAEGAYVFVQGGILEGTGWLGSVAGIPTSIQDPFAPTLGSKAVTFIQFHGQGTYTAKDGIVLDNTEFRLNYISLNEKSDEVNDRLAIANSFVAIQDVNEPYGISKLKLGTMFKAFGTKHYQIDDSDENNGFKIRVASSDHTPGEAIEFFVGKDTVGRDGGQKILTMKGDGLSIDFTGPALIPDGDNPASSIVMKAGTQGIGGVGANAKGGNIELYAGAGQNSSVGGNIVLAPGSSQSGLDGYIDMPGKRFVRLPRGTNAEAGSRAADGSVAAVDIDECLGAVRLNKSARAGEGLEVLEYFNGKEWVQVEGSSFMIHDDPEAVGVPYDTFMSAAGYTRDANGKVIKDNTDAIDAVVDGSHVFTMGKEAVGTVIHSLGKFVLSAGNGVDRNVTNTTVPGAALEINTIGADEAGGMVDRKGTNTTGAISIQTGSNTNATTGVSGSININSGNHALSSGSVRIETGTTSSNTTTAGVGDIVIRTGSMHSSRNDALAGTVYIAADKLAGTGRNNVVIGTPAVTLSNKISGKVIEVGVTDLEVDGQASSSIKIGVSDGPGTLKTTETGSVSIGAKNVSVVASAEATVEAGLIKIGTNKNTKEVEIGYVMPEGAGTVRDYQATVTVAGQVVRMYSDDELIIKNTNADGLGTLQGIVIDAGEDKLTGAAGVIKVVSPKYADAVTRPEHIPNLGYIQKVFGSGELGGAGSRVLDIAQAYKSNDPTGVEYPAGSKAFQIGAELPKGARISRVTVTVLNNFKFATPAISKVKIFAADTATSTTKIDLMNSDDDFDVIGAKAGDAFISEFGALRAGTKKIFCVFDEAPDTTGTLGGGGEITVLVEFVSSIYRDTEIG